MSDKSKLAAERISKEHQEKISRKRHSKDADLPENVKTKKQKSSNDSDSEYVPSEEEITGIYMVLESPLISNFLSVWALRRLFFIKL